MMKIGVSSYSFARYLMQGHTYSEILKIASEIGFEGMEFIDLVEPVWGIEGDPMEMAKALRKEADELGIEIPAYTIYANFLCDDQEAETARVCSCLDIAKVLGAKVMRFDIATSLRKLPGYTWESGVREMAPYIRRVAEYGATLGIRTAIENHGIVYQDAARVEDLIRAVGHPNYGWLVDMGNFLCADNDPLLAVRRAAPFAFHAHAKDIIVKESCDPAPAGFGRSRGRKLMRSTTLGHGSVPVLDCIKALADAGYDGWISLEFEGPEENLEAVRDGYKYLSACVQAVSK